MTEYSDLHIEVTLPRPWEEEESFNDLLYDWMSRAPWLALSFGAHVIAFIVLSAIPWNAFFREEERTLDASIEQPLPEAFEEPPPEEPEPEPIEEPLEEPQLQDTVLSDHPETEDDLDMELTQGDPDFSHDATFDHTASNDIIGIGGNAGGKLGGRFGGRQRLTTRGGRPVATSIQQGLDWLSTHQDDDGKWDCDGFMKHDPRQDPCDGLGAPGHDVGMTGLALLAFLGDGSTTKQGEYRDHVRRGLAWLRDQQDESGLIGDQLGHSFLYNHGIASLAMTEAYYLAKSPRLKTPAQRAVNYITRARNPYGAWRYEVPPNGENDTSVTGWMVFALKSAEEGGLRIDPDAYNGALSWFDEATDPSTGRVGYTETGTLSSRQERVNDHFSPEKAEALTAVGLLCRFFLGQDPDDEPIMVKHADLLRNSLPEWDPDGFGCDMYAWYYGTYAMWQMGGKRHWEAWESAMRPAVLDSQRKGGSAHGSWDPVGPWGYAGGRVYSTSLMVLCLEVYYRYGKVLGGR